jgi:hypothetical protein
LLGSASHSGFGSEPAIVVGNSMGASRTVLIECLSAPPGTSVNATGGGLFQTTNVERNVQMQPASGGPAQQSSPFPGY